MEEEKQRKMFERGGVRGHPYPPNPGPPENVFCKFKFKYHKILRGFQYSMAVLLVWVVVIIIVRIISSTFQKGKRGSYSIDVI